MPDRLRKWVRGLRLENRPSSRGFPSVPASNPPPPEPPSASEPPGIDPKATSPANAAIDNLTVALGLVQQVANIVREVPFIAPAAALMAEILEVYKEAKATGDKRDVLLANVAELTRDLCGTILRMEATNHVDLIGRLKMDIEALLAKASLFIKRYDTQGVVKHLAARNELGSEILALNRELDSFGARFRTNRLVDLALNQSVNTRTLNRVHDMVKTGKMAGIFKDKQGQAVNSALRRIILQLSAQSPNPSKTLEEHYKLKSGGQNLPTYQELQKILEALLMELGHTYILISSLMHSMSAKKAISGDLWTSFRHFGSGLKHHCTSYSPANPAVSSQKDSQTPRGLEGLGQTRTDEGNAKIADPVHHRSDRAGLSDRFPTLGPVAPLIELFRMAACLIVDISRCPWEDELDKTLDNLPDDLFGIYDRFLQGIRPEHILYAEAALRWLVFSRKPLALHELADAIAFDFSDPTQYIYKPSRREGNVVMIPRWLEGLVTVNYDYVVLAHSSVQDYLLSTRFTSKFGWDFSAGLSHTFLARTCIGYLLYFADDALKEEELQSYPLIQYAADLCNAASGGREQTIQHSKSGSLAVMHITFAFVL
ncbi:hypothetical protein DFH09DRAFT_1274797 [Mycena vulgaris]|nr:hypothetical protein DFH09DRAFT_1274797 [Mycena vulgaris]